MQFRMLIFISRSKSNWMFAQVRAKIRFSIFISSNSRTNKYNIIYHYHWLKQFKMRDGGEKIQQIARGTYLRSPILGLATAIHFHPIRRTFYSLISTYYSEYAPTAPSKFYKSRATERPISIPILHFSSLELFLHALLPLAPSLPLPSSPLLSSSLNAAIHLLWTGKPFNATLDHEHTFTYGYSFSTGN